MARKRTKVATSKPDRRPHKFRCRRCSVPVVTAELSADGKRSSVRWCDDCRIDPSRKVG